MRKSSLGSLALLILSLLISSPAVAGSITVSSIWNAGNAMRKARSRVPAGATITNSECVTVQVRNDNHYRCTVKFTTTP